MKQISIHTLIRWSATVGVLVLCLRRILYLSYSGLLPSKNWQPNSIFAKWLGITINGLSELVLLLILLGLPFCLYASFRKRNDGSGKAAIVIDTMFSAVVYGTAYLLLAPPKMS